MARVGLDWLVTIQCGTEKPIVAESRALLHAVADALNQAVERGWYDGKK